MSIAFFIEIKMIKIIPAEKPYKSKNGDLVCSFDNKEISKYLTNQKSDSQKIIPLGIIHPIPWTALSHLGIDYSNITARYTCPYTEYEHFAILPVAVIVNGDIKTYAKVHHYNPDFVLDWEWHQKMIPDRLALSRIDKVLLGSGYTAGTRINDGSGSLIQCRAILENGDILHLHLWEWYNK